MIKFKQGYVTNTETGATKDIIVKAATPNNLKEIVFGGGLVLIGIAYLTATAFRNGSKNYEVAELKALDDCQLLSDMTTDV